MNPIWQDRWQALEKQLQDMVARYGKNPGTDQNSTLLALTDSLLAFGQDQFNFFWEGFRTGQLLPAMMLPQDHVLRATLDQVAFDMAIIQRIESQRQQPQYQKTLAQADKLTQAALNVAIDGGLLPQCGVLTYFNKSANIRLIPYAPLALIGVPFSAETTAMDFLAIPHEVGHFVYHHSPGLAAALHARIPLYPNWINRWIEEIFADVYGALVAGPVIGLSFQHILTDNAQEKFIADDGAHPPDAIRPFAYCKSLDHLNHPKAAAALEKSWGTRLAERHQPKMFQPHNSSEAATLADAQMLLENTAVDILTYLQQARLVNQPAPWSADSDDLTLLLDNFGMWLKKPLKVDWHGLTAVADQIGVAKAGGQPENLRTKGSTQTWRDWFKAQSRQNPDLRVPAQAWTPIFTTGHWPVKGPEGNSDGGL
ncbi:MAG: hypothetical protein KC434_06325 [Anaerolineales bacterium]|nr:hypothetical protein [Anaerolineales bacterium]